MPEFPNNVPASVEPVPGSGPELRRVTALRVDEVLDALLYTINAGLSMPLTLALPAGVLTGRVVPLSEYLEALAGQLRGAGSVGESLARFFHDPDAPQPSAEERLAAATSVPIGTGEPAGFLHLVDAYYVEPNGSLPTRGPGLNVPGMIIRVRVADVSGWSLGSLDLGTPVRAGS